MMSKTLERSIAIDRESSISAITLFSFMFLSLKTPSKLRVSEKMRQYSKEAKKRFPVQWMESLNPTSHGTGAMTKVEHQFLLEKSWKQGILGATLVLQVTPLGRQSTSHNA